MKSLRSQLWRVLEPDTGDSAWSRWFDYAMVTLIVSSVVIAAGLTVESWRAKYGATLRAIEIGIVGVFLVEYIARLVCCTQGPARGRPIAGRLRYALRPMMVIDLLAILPSILTMMPIGGPYLRALRLLRLFRIAKLTRYPKAFALLRESITRRKEELVITLSVTGILLVVASFLLYELEHDAQPEAFSSVPATMWWAVATLTTVGYGDIYPVTVLGKVVGALVAILCVGLVGMPTAVLAGSFIETVQAQRSASQRSCPHCGKKP